MTNNYIAHLDMIENHSLRGERWRALSVECGAPLREYDGPVGHLDKIVDFMRGTTGMVLPYPNFLTTPELAKSISELVSQGHHLLVWIDPNWLKKLNAFLHRYGLAGTNIGVYAMSSEIHPKLLSLDRKLAPENFYPHPLLDGVNRVLLKGPNAIWYDARTTPILTLPKDQCRMVDRLTDLPTDWIPRELSCLVGVQVGSGGILAASCEFIRDPNVGPTGVHFPGISADDNEVLAANILKWLAGHRFNSQDMSRKAFDLINHIERTLAEFVHNKLKNRYGDDDSWNNGVPEAIRLDCVQRREKERNTMPKWAYLDLVHWKTILEKNWQLFEPDFAAVGWKGGKAAALSWFVRFNEIRNHVMHPTRRHFVANLVDHSAVSTLNDILRRIQRLGVQSKTVH